MSENAFADRLKKLIGSDSRSLFARRCGFSDGALKNYLNGSMPSADKALRIAEVCNVDVRWLVFGTDPVSTDDSERERERNTRIAGDGDSSGHIVVSGHSMGHPLTGDRNIVDHLAFKPGWVRDRMGIEPGNLLLVEASGDGMAPTIRDRDLVLVDTSISRVRDAGVYVLDVGGDLCIKRIEKKLDGSMIVRSDNSLYSPESVAAENVGSLRIIGQVIWRGGRI